MLVHKIRAESPVWSSQPVAALLVLVFVLLWLLFKILTKSEAGHKIGSLLCFKTRRLQYVLRIALLCALAKQNGSVYEWQQRESLSL